MKSPEKNSHQTLIRRKQITLNETEVSDCFPNTSQNVLSRKTVTQNRKPKSHTEKCIKSRGADWCQLYFLSLQKWFFTSLSSQNALLPHSWSPSHHNPECSASDLRDTSQRTDGFRLHSFSFKKKLFFFPLNIMFLVSGSWYGIKLSKISETALWCEKLCLITLL